MAGTGVNISTAVNCHTASIQSCGESIDGLSVRYGWKLNAGGKAIGWVANNDGTEGGLDFVVDYFRLWKADGTASRAPFEFRNGDIFIANAAIENLSVGTIKIARSEERRVGKECVSTCRSRWSPDPSKKKKRKKKSK